jgi:hypothetical protein
MIHDRQVIGSGKPGHGPVVRFGQVTFVLPLWGNEVNGSVTSDSVSVSPEVELSAQFDERPLIDALPVLVVSVRVPENCGMENQSS